jgi:hypothetical protein
LYGVPDKNLTAEIFSLELFAFGNGFYCYHASVGSTFWQ